MKINWFLCGSQCNVVWCSYSRQLLNRAYFPQHKWMQLDTTVLTMCVHTSRQQALEWVLTNLSLNFWRGLRLAGKYSPHQKQAYIDSLQGKNLKLHLLYTLLQVSRMPFYTLEYGTSTCGMEEGCGLSSVLAYKALEVSWVFPTSSGVRFKTTQPFFSKVCQTLPERYSKQTLMDSLSIEEWEALHTKDYLQQLGRFGKKGRDLLCTSPH